jgi:hypothetical protein
MNQFASVVAWCSYAILLSDKGMLIPRHLLPPLCRSVVWGSGHVPPTTESYKNSKSLRRFLRLLQHASGSLTIGAADVLAQANW